MKHCITLALLSLTGWSLVSTAASATDLPSGVPDLRVAVDRYVQTEVSCNSGRANVAVRSHSSGIEQVSFESIWGLGTDSRLSPVTCRDGEFRFRGKTLTNIEVATLATTTRAVAADRNDWVLILTPINQPATHVTGFSSEVACMQAVNIWQGRDRAKDEQPGHAVCVQR
ncbi:hypothetical protein [Pseudomonas fragariae (ex Marin et al. 2024)]|uniref:hypothetical protein n=1 Tax=Pseudomonas fragariae (ex Marin et al. 2024) TaxID=3080056 RepID=UPI003F799338